MEGLQIPESVVLAWDRCYGLAIMALAGIREKLTLVIFGSAQGVRDYIITVGLMSWAYFLNST